MHKSVHFRAGRDVRIHHQKMEFLLLAFLVNGADQHAAGLDSHHLPRGQIHDGDAGLPEQLLRLIIGVDTAQNSPFCAGSVVKRELQELFGLRHGLAGQDLNSPKIALRKGLEIYLILEQRLDDDVGEVDFSSAAGTAGTASATGACSAGVSPESCFSRPIGFMVGN